jgi:hypothetical protein
MENEDWIIIVMKIWLDDSCTNCKPNSNFKQYFEANESLVEETYNLIEKYKLFEEFAN